MEVLADSLRTLPYPKPLRTSAPSSLMLLPLMSSEVTVVFLASASSSYTHMSMRWVYVVPVDKS